MENAIYTNGQLVPPKILRYYIDNGYAKQGIPLNAETANKIAEILRLQGIDI